MTIRLKTFLTLVATAVLLFFALYIFSQLTIVSNFKKQENDTLDQNVKRAMKILEKDMNSLNRTCGDWAQWDDTYDFLNNKNKYYIEKNLTDDSFNTLKLNVIAFFDNNGNMVYEKNLGEPSGNGSFSLENYIFDKKKILKGNSVDDVIKGIMRVNNRPLLIAARPITNSDKTSGVQGTLIIGRFIDMEQIAELENITSAKVSISVNSDKSQGMEVLDSYSNILKDSRVYLQGADNGNVEGYSVIKDVFGRDSFRLTVSMPRLIYNQGVQSFKVFMIIYIISAAIFIWITMYILGLTHLSRLERFSNFMKEVAVTKDMRSRVEMEGRDEISNLAGITNSMFEEISKTNRKIIENEERLSFVLEGTNDGLWDLDIRVNNVFLSPRAKSIMGYDGKTDVEKLYRFHKYVYRNDLKEIVKLYKTVLMGLTDFYNLEIQILNGEGKRRWIQIKGKVVSKDDKGSPLRMSGTISDITENKINEDKISYLSYHDILTGLRNRAFIEENYLRIDKEGQFPTSIILGDVNGLKVVNDAFGHKEGDSLLISIANILRKACRSRDIIGRVGGDEFVVVLPNVNEGEANNICERIKKLCDEADYKYVKPSIALGVATKDRAEISIYNIIEIAENRMYKNKLLEDRSSRHSIIASMERSLLETDFETREHAKRLQVMSRKIGEYLRLTGSQMDELSLLSTLHDIGKIAIPREILTKPGALTSEEWEIIKRHCEIGYRIALSSNELSSIADAILSHHEKWDGSGYPRELKGEGIPLISRIIALVDAYDVITNSRPYKKEMTHEEAMNEIVRCSGTHFDPDLVKVFVNAFRDGNTNSEG